MYCYTAYGLSIHSVLPLPELLPGEEPPSVVVRLGSVKRPPSPTAGAPHCLPVTRGEVYLCFEDVGTFLVQHGRDIIVEPAPGVEAQVLRLFMLGPALGVLLHQRGLLTLHASAVAVHGSAVAFLGGSGWGKSTMAATFHRRGHTMLADDVTAVQIDSERPMVLPAFPQFKLWPDTASALGHALETLPPLRPGLEKRALRAASGFSLLPLPLKHIYVLAEGMTPHIEPLPGQEALLELVCHSYAVRSLLPAGSSRHFLQCANLIKHVKIRRLRTQRSFSVLDRLAQMVEEDVSGQS